MRKLRGNSSALDRSASSVGGDTGPTPWGVRKGDDTPESTAAGLPPPVESRRGPRTEPVYPAALSSGSEALDALLTKCNHEYVHQTRPLICSTKQCPSHHGYGRCVLVDP